MTRLPKLHGQSTSGGILQPRHPPRFTFRARMQATGSRRTTLPAMPPTRSRRAPREAQTRRPAAPAVPASLTAVSAPGLDDDGIYTNTLFDGSDLSDQNSAAIEIDKCRIANSDLSGTRLSRAMVMDTVAERSNLSNLQATNSSLVRVEMTACRMTGFSWANGRLRDVTFRDCRLDFSSFQSSTATDSLFVDCNLRQADFHDADLRGATFRTCDLSGAQLSGARMDGTRLINCTLEGASGVTSMAGAVVASSDMVTLAHLFASALGINVVDEESPD
ncbi:pentapeptide repeat-containing protein [Frankia sp. AgPm24]|uniref:pentapeptide repeat-containing protein n=1 Tax=Frankia sp. AgPm24 TaxID=631128 RepID=UPI00200F272D|nr:pentapeptide repeat-containing protein [Frankia sp. AgPm24]MCK9923177.1 pentapeptide repeat-containing protein [Frankia sp. AgPm24]